MADSDRKQGLGKFAFIVYTLEKLANNTPLAREGLAKLKSAIAVFINNSQRFPLVYESSWKVSYRRSS